jgi:hypothetical protein
MAKKFSLSSIATVAILAVLYGAATVILFGVRAMCDCWWNQYANLIPAIGLLTLGLHIFFIEKYRARETNQRRGRVVLLVSTIGGPIVFLLLHVMLMP